MEQPAATPPVEPVIRADRLRKEYLIHTRQATSLKEIVVRNLFQPGEVRPMVALNDVSFTVRPGRSLAIVGSNGSGKSTLLKLIAGISDPTAGSIHATGRIAALLELGAGFEFEFTGMENIFLQCAIQGFTRPQILERLDSILSFAQLDQFIHTPVKRYSSGMRVRLGFAIAAHVDADILLLDEVMTVGDAAFQIKCLRKIKELREQGKTILFVSHLLEHIEAMADEVLWLEKGNVVAWGTADEVLPRFYEALMETGEEDSREVHLDGRTAAALPVGRHAAREARFVSIELFDDADTPRRTFHTSECPVLRARVQVRESLERLELSFAFGTVDALRAAWSGSGSLLENVEPGEYLIEARVEDHHLTPGRYLLSVMLGDPRDLGVTYDLHLRLYAVSFHDDRRRIVQDPEAGRLRPIGRFEQ